MTRTALLTALVAALSLGCVEKAEEETAAVDMEQIRSMVSTSAPTPRHPLDIQFEGKISLLGYDINVAEITPGQPFELTWYWRVDKPLEAGWRLFTHVADARGESRFNADMFGPIRQAYQPGVWKAAEYIKDTQTITLPPNWNSPAAKFLLGIWKGDHRLQVSRGTPDNESRVEALSMKVSGIAATEVLPTVVARKVTAPIVIDGKLDEGDWLATQVTAALVNPMTGGAPAFNTRVRVLFDAERIYLGYEVQDSFLKSTFTQTDDHLWEQDTIEVMLDPDGDSKNYFEVQVSPMSVVFDTRYDTVRQPRPFGDVAWSSQAVAKAIANGTPNDDGDDQGYTVEMSMSWSAFAVGATPATPPSDGATWRINFYVMDSQRDGQRAIAWSAPKVPDFHTPQRFGTVVFGRPAAAPVEVTPTNAAVPNAARNASGAALNTPEQPRAAGDGRTKVDLLPAAADALRKQAEPPAPNVATPPTAHAH